MTTETEIAQRAEKQPNLLCFIEQFPLAMQAVARVHDYDRGGLAKGDYRPSLLRHLLGIGEHDDHEAAVAWNALAALELRERARVDHEIGLGSENRLYVGETNEMRRLRLQREDIDRKFAAWRSSKMVENT